MVNKINISLKNELLERTDKEARKSHISRSALFAKAMEHYLEEREMEKKKEKRLKASLVIDKFREEFGGWDATGEVLDWRARKASALDVAQRVYNSAIPNREGTNGS